MGEHAVLHGQPALVASTDLRLTVTATPRQDGRVSLRREGQTHEGPWPGLDDHPAFRFALVGLRKVGVPEGGLDLRFESDMPDTVGLGSSAAVTVATLAAVQGLSLPAEAQRRWDESVQPLDQTVQSLDNRLALFRATREVIREVQGTGSGADAAASVFGGLVALEDGEPRRLSAGLPEMALVYCGYKTPTPEVIRKVDAQLETIPALRNLFPAMGEVTRTAIATAEAGNWAAVGQAMDAYQGHLDALGVNTPELEAILTALRRMPGLLGAKISGSGLGDCALGLGAALTGPLPGTVLPVRPGTEGVKRERIA